MIYASAGHDPVMVIGKSAHRHLPTTGPLLGIFEDLLFAERTEPLGADDLVVLATDGVTECGVAHGKGPQFGTTGIIRAVASARNHSPRAARDAISRSLDAFARGSYRDDATIAVLAAG